jgi:glycosyltransferase involved in cell wall biosynthesis
MNAPADRFTITPPTPRVLLLCERLDVAGGVERFVCQLANDLVQRGFQVQVGSVDTPAAQVRYPLAAGVAVLTGTTSARRPEPAPSGRRLVEAWRMARAQWRSGRALAALMRASPAEVIVLNGLVTACSALLFAGRDAARVVCCDHNHFEARSGLWQRLRARLYPRVAALVSLSLADLPRFKALHPNSRVIYNASSLQVDAAALPATPNAQNVSNASNASNSSSSPLVLAVGRHAAQKGFDLLLLAWRRVLDQLPQTQRRQARLRIVGDGPLEAQLRELATTLNLDDSVEWLAPTPQIAAQYRAASIFVLSSRYEGMPLVLLEAQAMGLPCVAFDCPTGPREIITPDTGVVVPADDVAALAQAVVGLLAQPELRARMGRAALARSRSHFSAERHVADWAGLLRQVATATRSDRADRAAAGSAKAG